MQLFIIDLHVCCSGGRDLLILLIIHVTGSVVNTFLNENSQDIFEELRPQIAVQVKDMLTMLANQTLVALPVDFLDDVPLDPSSDDGSVLTENSDSKNNDRNSYRSLPISSANLTSYS